MKEAVNRDASVGGRIRHRNLPNHSGSATELKSLRSQMCELAKKNNLRLGRGRKRIPSRIGVNRRSRRRAHVTIVEDLKMVARPISSSTCMFTLASRPGNAHPPDERLPLFLPHIIALSTNSPFWLGMDTGLKSIAAKYSTSFRALTSLTIFPVMASTKTSSNYW